MDSKPENSAGCPKWGMNLMLATVKDIAPTVGNGKGDKMFTQRERVGDDHQKVKFGGRSVRFLCPGLSHNEHCLDAGGLSYRRDSGHHDRAPHGAPPLLQSES